jgi:hypothetical protein
MAQVLQGLLAGVTRQLDANEIARIQDDIGGSVAAFQEIMAEVKRERMVALAATPDPAPLSRTLLRLRHDLVIIGRAATVPLPDVFVRRLGPPLTRVGKDASQYLRASGNALELGRLPPPLQAFEASLKAYDSEVASLRTEGLTRTLSSGEVERLFALGFALDQLHRNFADLARCVLVYARGVGVKTT